MIAFITRCDFAGSGPPSNLGNTVGTICQDRPNLSLSQPHWTSVPPVDNFSQCESSSSCVWQFTTNETASVNLKCGPPLSATNFIPSSSNSTVIADPVGPGPASPY